MGSRRFAALVVMAGLLGGAAACGGDDGDSSEGSTATSAADGSTSSTQRGTSDAAAQPTSMEDWEALWKEERDAIVERIKSNKWGTAADGKNVTGPDGFTIDLAKCPSGWSQTEGVTDTTIKIGLVGPQSGPGAEAAGIAFAHEVLFDHYNDNGGFSDVTGKTRSVQMILRDDAYDPTKTIPLVDELIDSEHVFAVETTGSPSTLRTYDKLNQRCIPQPLPASGHPAFGDPVNHPWTTTSSINYATEAVLWGQFIEQRLDEFGGKAKIASLRINSEFGSSYDAALKAYLATSEHKDDIEYVSQTMEPTAATATDEMTTLAAEHADMFIAMTTGAPCSQIINEAAQNGMQEDVKYKFISSACKATTPMATLGEAGEGWWTVGGGLKDVDNPSFDDDAFVVEARQWMADAGRKMSPSYNLGFYYSWTLAQALQIAGQLDGGITRSNVILALRTIDMTNPMLLPGLNVKMDGNADAYLLEGSDISQWDLDAASWVQDSITVLDVQTPNCAWDQAAAKCK